MKHYAKLRWKKKPEEVFTNHKYSRLHTWLFDGGTAVRASSSPEIIPAPMSDVSAIDPEEAFIAALSSCHMLFFLSVTASRQYVVDSYEDEVEGITEKDENKKISITKITLRPKVIFSGDNIPSSNEIKFFHETAHKKCYLANSVKAKISIHPV